MTTTTSPNLVEPPREDEHVVALTGRRRTRHLARLLQTRDMLARLYTERYCHALPDAHETFTQMANVEEEIALLFPDVHTHLSPAWIEDIPDTVHEPGDYNPKCGICRAGNTNQIRPSAA